MKIERIIQAYQDVDDGRRQNASRRNVCRYFTPTRLRSLYKTSTHGAKKFFNNRRAFCYSRRLWETFPFHSLRATLKVPQCRHYKNFLHRPPTLELLPSEEHNDYFLIYACLQITPHSGHCSPSRNDRTVKIYLEWIISRRFSPTFGFMLRFFHFTNIFTRKGFRQCVNVSPLGNFCSVGASTTIPDTQCRWFKMPSGFSKYRRFCTIDRALSPISRFLLPFHQSDWTLRNFNDC